MYLCGEKQVLELGFRPDDQTAASKSVSVSQSVPTPASLSMSSRRAAVREVPAAEQVEHRAEVVRVLHRAEDAQLLHHHVEEAEFRPFVVQGDDRASLAT